ncbi:MAG: hypothetical protein EOO27_09225 [Comamonadaceae bacterium]|nr:MAG: hypothetical protein EOO27_09225 [Comamonadaceae bacterium]
MTAELFTPRPLVLARANAQRFTPAFLAYLSANLHVYDDFEREAMRVVAKGFAHYSARTIIEVLRHHSALAAVGGPWKLNDWHTPYLARLFALANPGHRGLFEFRVAKALRRRAAANADYLAQAAGGV